MNIYVTSVPWNTYADRLRLVRERVFIEEQQVPRELEWDDADQESLHLLALTEAGQPVGCARLLPSGQIGRMAVLPAQRGTGLGLRLLQAALDEAVRQGMPAVFLHAQTHAIGFYRKAGFVAQGPEFMEAGIPHVEMRLALPIPFEPVGELPKPLIRPEPAPTAADQAGLVGDTGESACIEGLLTCLTQPRRQLLLLSQHLDPLLFDRPEVVEAFSQFVRHARTAHVRLLLKNSSLIISRGHRLVELARRLDSKIEIRRIPDEQPVADASFATWDQRGYWLMPDFRDYQALRNAYDPVQATRLTEQFTRLWARSAPDPELRLLRL